MSGRMISIGVEIIDRVLVKSLFLVAPQNVLETRRVGKSEDAVPTSQRQWSGS